jgi:hypothetical protein
MLADLLSGIVHDRQPMREAHSTSPSPGSYVMAFASGSPSLEPYSHSPWDEQRFREIFKRTVDRAACRTAQPLCHIDQARRSTTGSLSIALRPGAAAIGFAMVRPPVVRRLTFDSRARCPAVHLTDKAVAADFCVSSVSSVRALEALFAQHAGSGRLRDSSDMPLTRLLIVVAHQAAIRSAISAILRGADVAREADAVARDRAHSQ